MLRLLGAAGVTCVLAVAVMVLVGGGSARHTVTPAHAASTEPKIPLRIADLAFEPSAGRAGPGVDYVARGPGYDVSLTRGGPVLRARAGRALRASLIGSSARRPRAHERRPGVVNWFVGKRSQWRRNLPMFG